MLNKKKIKVSFLGCGRIFEKHYSAIKSNSRFFEIDSVCDVNISKIEKKIKLPKLKKFNNINNFLNNTNSDLYVILTPSGFHAEHIKKILRKKNNILVEKPVAINYGQSQQLIKFLANKRNKNVFVVKQNRYNPAIVELKKTIREKKLGKIFLSTIRLRWNRNHKYFSQDSWRGTWKYDGGVLANQASHHIDLLQWMNGEIINLTAYGTKVTRNIKATDTVVCVLEFKNGTKGIIEATTATYPKNLEGSLSILGTKGTVVVGGFAVSKLDVWEQFGLREKSKFYKRKFKNNSDIYGHGHKKLYQEINNFFRNKKYDLPDIFEAIKSVKIFDKIYASIEKHKEVKMKDTNFSKRLGR